MTLPDERYRAVRWAERFLRELALDKTKYPKVPKLVRQEAHSILRHFPGQWDMDCAAQIAPEIFQSKIEPLTRMVMTHARDLAYKQGWEDAIEHVKNKKVSALSDQYSDIVSDGGPDPR